MNESGSKTMRERLLSIGRHAVTMLTGISVGISGDAGAVRYLIRFANGNG